MGPMDPMGARGNGAGFYHALRWFQRWLLGAWAMGYFGVFCDTDLLALTNFPSTALRYETASKKLSKVVDVDLKFV